MTRAQPLTSKALLGAPRRTAAVPNRNGSLALYSVSTHDWDSGQTTTELQVMNLKTTEAWTITSEDGVSDAQWIPGTGSDVIYLKSGPSGTTRVFVTTIMGVAQQGGHNEVAQIDAPVANLKLRRLDDASVAFVVTGLVGEDGKLFNEVTEKKDNTGRVYDTVNVRQWDVYFKKQRYSLWYSALAQQGSKWHLSSQLHNLVQDGHLEVPYNMYDVVDPLDFFDVSRQGVAFLARDLMEERDPRKAAAAYPYFVCLTSYAVPPYAKSLKKIHVDGIVTHKTYTGGNVLCSPDGSRIAFQMADVNDSFNPRLYMAPVATLEAVDVIQLNHIEFTEQDFPSGFKFAGHDNNILLVDSESKGRTSLATLRLEKHEKPRVIKEEGTVAGYYPLIEGDCTQLLVSSHNLLDSSLWQVLTVTEDSITQQDISSMTNYGKDYGLSRKQIQELWIPGADGLLIHTWVTYPRNFDKTKKWPWVFSVHGGPQSAEGDKWATRWNSLHWAEQGVIVVAPNFSGSTGYGVDFTRRVATQYGGKPFEDCNRVLEYLEDKPWLDHSKAILTGASFGGYMVSWFFCHDVIKKFCGAIWHNGIFSIPFQVLEGDKYGEDGDYGGDSRPWINNEGLTRWDPAAPERLAKWTNCPPTLLIHSALDYRIPSGQGLAAFKTLQAHGVPSRFLTFDDEGHWVQKPGNALRWHTEIFEWVEKCTSGSIKRGDKMW